jgi:hypothetical protein
MKVLSHTVSTIHGSCKLIKDFINLRNKQVRLALENKKQERDQRDRD